MFSSFGCVDRLEMKVIVDMGRDYPPVWDYKNINCFYTIQSFDEFGGVL